MKKILIATTNIGKKREILECFGKKLKNTFEFLTLKDFPKLKEGPEENGKKFEENAAIKAIFFGEKHNIATIAEDSGIILEAFPKKFGIRTRREIDTKDDIEWLRRFLDILENEKNRKATFYSAFSFYEPSTKKSQEFLGMAKGEITEFPGAPIEKGIPISAVFKPKNSLEVYSAMKKEEKNQLSHRGIAAKKLLEFLRSH